jgi:hypothetical protein
MEEGGNRLAHDNKATKNHPGYIIFYDGNAKYQGEVVRNKTLSNKRRKSWLLFVNVIQKFRKAVKMWVPLYIHVGHGTQFSKSLLFRQRVDVSDL